MTTMNSFQELNLPEPLAKALKAMAFDKPTPIQEKAIPAALDRRDVIGSAQTGSGKTAAFSIPMIVKLLKAPQKTALVLAPTRELADQIAGVIKKLTLYLPELRSALLIGGNAMGPQLKSLAKNPRILIATPGRLVDHLNRGNLSLSSVDLLVLDEADRMLDMGFAPQLAQILRFLPKTRQTLFFSATFPPNIQTLAQKFLKDPVRVTVGEVSKPAEKIDQAIIETTHQKKNDVLLDEINARSGSMLIFARTQSRTDRLARTLTEYGLPVGRIHGGRTQGQRNQALNGFRDGKFRILVATDLAARGIDVAHIAHVINYDLPQVAEDYVHRIGRTARAGARGQALSILTPDDRLQWREISKLLKTTAPKKAATQAQALVQ